jgi:hypothetical protein
MWSSMLQISGSRALWYGIVRGLVSSFQRRLPGKGVRTAYRQRFQVWGLVGLSLVGICAAEDSGGCGDLIVVYLWIPACL